MDPDPNLSCQVMGKPPAQDDAVVAEPRGKPRSKSQTVKGKALANLAVAQGGNNAQEMSKEETNEQGRTGGPEAIYPDYTTILPRFRYSSGSHINEVVEVRRPLCRDCAKIDLDTLLKRPHKTIAGQAVKKQLGPARDLKTRPCALCHLIYSSLGPWWENVSGLIPLRTFSSMRMTDKTWSSIETNVIQAQHMCRYIVSQPQGVNGPIRIVKDHIQNYDIFKGWINLCRDYHTKVCAVETSHTAPLQRLIDCETRTIIPASNHPYVALSYVWGVDEIVTFSEILPSNMPNTIEDTIIVTLKLGFRYLWIDRYCIDQQSKEDQDAQMPTMDIIYQNADVTIIAAAGGDPSYGLPGVSNRKRAGHASTMCSKVGRHFLITTEGTYPLLSISNSKWNTRAWTYQEAIFSRRRLVFADEEVYFECYGMHCSESHNFPLFEMHRDDMQGFKHTFCQGQQVGIFPKGVGTSRLAIFHRIGEYAKLNLTHPEDILRGISGILNSFQRGHRVISHYAGIPIVSGVSGRPQLTATEWTLTIGFLFSLLWNISIPSQRRTFSHGTEFPSWSWTGWHGAVDWEEAINGSPSIQIDPDIELNVELMDGQVLKLEAYQDLKVNDASLAQPSIFVRISAWTVRIYQLRASREENRYVGKIDSKDGGYIEWDFRSISRVPLLPDQVCTGLILDSQRVRDQRPTLLILSRLGDGKLERIGFGKLTLFRTFTKEGIEQLIYDPNGYVIFGSQELPELVKSWEEVRIG